MILWNTMPPVASPVIYGLVNVNLPQSHRQTDQKLDAHEFHFEGIETLCMSKINIIYIFLIILGALKVIHEYIPQIHVLKILFFTDHQKHWKNAEKSKWKSKRWPFGKTKQSEKATKNLHLASKRWDTWI